MDKDNLREKYIALRDTLSTAEVEEMSLDIANKTLSLNIWDYTNYHTYLTINSKKEVDTSYLLHILQGRDKSIGVSKANFEDTSLVHYLLQENTSLKLSKQGIPEPEDGILLDPSVFEVVFVPVMAYDLKGNRVGYGKGFYDRFLAQCKPTCLFVGLSFFEPEDLIDSTKNDIPLTMVVTPKTVYNF